MTDQPEFLYHYTNVETLALILRTKKMRFNSLLNVDDLEEAKSEGIENFGMHIFVSCFTSDSSESIPVWNMYSNKGSGVRIKLLNPPFERFTYHNETENYSVNYNGATFPIVYTDDPSKLYPQINRIIDDERWINAEETGRYKRLAWQFQNEWRAKLFVFNTNGNPNWVEPGTNPPITHFDVPLNGIVINNLSITLGFNLSHGNKLIVETLVKDFNQRNSANIIFEESEFHNLIKSK